MTKLVFDYNNINDISNGPITRAIDDLNKAIYDVGNLKIPNDFEYAQYLLNLPNENIAIKDSLIQKKTIIDNALKNYCKVQSVNYNLFSNTGNYVIYKRDGLKK